MRMLITGGSGFIGTALARECAAVGDSVSVTTRAPKEAEVASGAQALRYVIGEDRAAAVLEQAGGADVVVHLAGPSHVWRTEERGEPARQEILDGATDWLSATEAAGARLVLGGSCHQYGKAIERDGPQLSEDLPPRPDGVYAFARQDAENLVLEARGRGADVVAVRSFNHVGPGQRPGFFVPSLVRRIVAARREGAPFIEAGHLGVVRDLIDVRDGARAFRALAARGQAGRVYNIGTGQPLRLRDAVRTMLMALDAPDLEVRERSGLGATRDLGDHYADITRLREDTGFEPQHTFRDTVLAVRDELERAGLLDDA